MGHVRLGRLPKTRRWNAVVELLQTGSDVAQVAAAVADAAEHDLQSAKSDPALAYSVWLLSQLPLAARSDQFVARMSELGFTVGDEHSALSLVAGFSRAVDRHVAGGMVRTDLGELARQAASETLIFFIGAGSGSLFDSDAEVVRGELGRLATRSRFAKLAREFFARLTLKILDYYISREQPNHVGPGRHLSTFDDQSAFRLALERHCREAAEIVEAFAGGWFSKSNFHGTLTPEAAKAFTDYALTKMRDELRARRLADA